jgi:hypothetical protein
MRDLPNVSPESVRTELSKNDRLSHSARPISRAVVELGAFEPWMKDPEIQSKPYPAAGLFTRKSSFCELDLGVAVDAGERVAVLHVSNTTFVVVGYIHRR